MKNHHGKNGQLAKGTFLNHGLLRIILKTSRQVVEELFLSLRSRMRYRDMRGTEASALVMERLLSTHEALGSVSGMENKRRIWQQCYLP